MLKTDLDILAFINRHPGCVIEETALMTFVGEDAAQRLYRMRQDGLIRRDQHWYDSRPTTYTLDARGHDLLATHEQEVEQRRRREADQEKQKKEAKREALRKWGFELLKDSIIVILTLLVNELAHKFFG